MSHGKIIAIEGLDGVGKHTQAELLAKRLGWQLRSFPTHNGSSFANPVDGYLNGELSSNPNDVNPYAAAAMYAVDRYASYLTDWGKLYQDGTNFIMDRYMESNLIYHLGKLQSVNDKKAFCKNVISNEMTMGIPKADIVVFLDVMPEISQKLMTTRYNGDESKKDIHESSIEFQRQCRKNALFAKGECDNWMSIKCFDENAFSILPIEMIHEIIYDTVSNTINSK